MVTAQMVKALRERTGSGMMDCKKALDSSDGDIEKAVELLRTSGIAKADKKATRIAAQGRISFSHKDNEYALVEVNCETDFVAQSPDFIQFCDEVARGVLMSEISDIQSDAKLDKKRKDLIAKIGENISIRRFNKIKSTGEVGYYLHNNNIGVMVDLISDGTKTGAEIGILAKDLAMHIAAFDPKAIDEAGLASEDLEKEKKILKQQALASGKPAHIVEKMIVGKIKKFINENTLLGQKFVKDQDVSIIHLLKKNSAKVSQFVRFKAGEGIEKTEDDFVSEVMNQVK